MKRISLLFLLVVLATGSVHGRLPFYCSLDSRSEVEKAGGEVFGIMALKSDTVCSILVILVSQLRSGLCNDKCT